MMNSCCGNDKNACCSGEIVFKDLSKVKNPTEPEKTVNSKFLRNLKVILKNMI